MKFRHLTVALRLSMALILTLIVAAPHQVSSLALQQSGSTNNAIFLPVVTDGQAVTFQQNPNQPNEPTAPEDQVTITSDGWIRGQHLILWKGSASTVIASNHSFSNSSSQVPTEWTLDYDVLDLTGLIDAGKRTSANAILESFRANERVELVEPNYVYTSTAWSGVSASQLSAPSAPESAAAFIPNDPRQAEQFAWKLLDAYDAWDVTQGDAETVIAVVDTGVDLDHPDLIDKIIDGFDFVDRDAVADDGNFHGTHVAGSAAASTNNELDGAGACPNCAIMPIRALNDEGTGSLGDIAAGIIFAANNGADVINLSLGAPARSFILEQALNRAFDNGVSLICAAGNDNSSDTFFPAGFENCISVASVTETDQRSSFSNFGATVDVAAPGTGILSTFPNGEMSTINGTSMAAPHVAGLAGLLSSQGLSNTEIRTRLCNTADKIDGTGEFWQCGRINMLNAVTNTVGEEPTASPTDAPTVAPTATPRPTSTPTPNPTATPTATTAPTALPGETPNPYYPSSPITDGDFESGGGWTYSYGPVRSNVDPISGSYSVRLGGEANSTDSMEQIVTVPANGQLGYTWRSASTNTAAALNAGDRLVLEMVVQDGSGATVMLSHTPRPQEQVNRPTFDLSEFAGQSVLLRFKIESSASSSTPDSYTTFIVDDVDLK